MSELDEYSLNRASEDEIVEHLRTCDADFIPPLSNRVVINDYAKKIVSKATRFEAWTDGTLVGLVAAYCNDQEKRIAYITSVSVLREWHRKAIAARLINDCIEHARVLGMRQISLEVDVDNKHAIKLYEKYGFVVGQVKTPIVSMKLYLVGREEHE